MDIFGLRGKNEKTFEAGYSISQFPPYTVFFVKGFLLLDATFFVW